VTISNILTISRILMVPVLVAILLQEDLGSSGRLLAVVILLVASITDALDGYLARVRNEVTRLGTLLDPIADKLLISAALISVVQLGYAPAWIIVIILGREFAVSGIRLLAASEGIDVKVSHYGKFKMITQVIAVALLIYAPETEIYGYYMLWVVMALALISMALYFTQFWTGIRNDRREQLKHRRTFGEIKANVFSTTRKLRKMRLERKSERKYHRLEKRVSRQERRLSKARTKMGRITKKYPRLDI
jgi:CDP-diacylglycerol--glycerol-3-phosphate 3-phosphatidyltransferase